MRKREGRRRLRGITEDSKRGEKKYHVTENRKSIKYISAGLGLIRETKGRKKMARKDE